MKSSELNNALNNKYTGVGILSTLQLDNLITNPQEKERKCIWKNVFESEDLALLTHISFSFITENCSYFRYLKNIPFGQ